MVPGHGALPVALARPVVGASSVSRQTTLALSARLRLRDHARHPRRPSDPGDALGGTGSIQLNSGLHRAAHERASVANLAPASIGSSTRSRAPRSRALWSRRHHHRLGRDWRSAPTSRSTRCCAAPARHLGQPPIMSDGGTRRRSRSCAVVGDRPAAKSRLHGAARQRYPSATSSRRPVSASISACAAACAAIPHAGRLSSLDRACRVLGLCPPDRSLGLGATMVAGWRFESAIY